jgi:demethylmenaquinone methyltransferase/2-methoxy-6-polyprenyl-1,4-benzoquinol methylase
VKVVSPRENPADSDSKAQLVQQHFSNIAARYDLANDILSFGLQRHWKRVAVDLLALKPGDAVLDVCGGTADLALVAAAKAGPGQVLVYDFNREMLEVGRAKVSQASRASGILFIQGDAEQISLKDNSVNAAIVGFGIRNLTHLKRGFQEMHRVLKPGGRMVCLEFSQPPARWFRLLYDLYSHTAIPLVGKILAGSWEAYTYLTGSIRAFPAPTELSAILESIGFTQVTYHPLTQGIAVIHRGVKIEGRKGEKAKRRKVF